MSPAALELSVSEVRTYGIVGVAVVVLLAVVLLKVVTGVLGRTVTALVVLGVVALAWSQRSQLADSVRHCDPRLLGIHLRIDDPDTKAKCEELVRSGGAR